MHLSWLPSWTGWVSLGLVIAWRLFSTRPRCKKNMSQIANVLELHGKSILQTYVAQYRHRCVYQIFASRQFVDFQSYRLENSTTFGFFESKPHHLHIAIAMALHHQVDVDHSGSLNLREFILCMRKVREVELKAVKILGLFCGGGPRDKKIRGFLMGIPNSYEILTSSNGNLKSLIEGLDIFLFENESDRMILKRFHVGMMKYGCFHKWWVSPNLHTSSHDPFLVRKHPMEFVGDFPTICRKPPPQKMMTGKPWLRQMLMVTGSSPRKRCPTCWRVDAWGAVWLFFCCKRIGMVFKGEKTMAACLLFVFGFKKRSWTCQFLSVFFGILLSLEKDMFSKKLDLKWTWNGMPQFYNSQSLLQKLKAFLMLMDSVAIDIVGGNSKSSTC